MRKILAGMAVALVIVLAGCVGVVSVHPLSDDGDSVVDERLIGWWEPAPISGAEVTRQRLGMVVGRVPDHPTALEFVVLELDENDFVGVHRLRMHTIRRDGVWYLSIGDEGAFSLHRYSVSGSGRWDMEGLGTIDVAAAIEAGDVSGNVKRGPSGTDPGGDRGNIQEVLLTAPTDQLWTWLSGPGRTQWRKSSPLEWFSSLRPLPREVPVGE